MQEDEKKYSSYQLEFQEGKGRLRTSNMGLGTINEADEALTKRFSLEDAGGSLKAKLKSKTLQAIKQQMMRNSQYI